MENKDFRRKMRKLEGKVGDARVDAIHEAIAVVNSVVLDRVAFVALRVHVATAMVCFPSLFFLYRGIFKLRMHLIRRRRKLTRHAHLPSLLRR